jgi:hypothetical protein
LRYNSYHSDLIIASKYGLIKEGVAQRIPASTRSSWKKRDTSRILGYNEELLPPDFEGMVRTMATERKYRVMARGLYRVNQVLNGMLEECSEKKRLLHAHRERIVETVKEAGEKLGTGKLLRWFGISRQQFAYWKSSMKACSLSPIGICRKRHPHQLLPTEVKRVREYLKDPAFAHWPATSIYYKMVRRG